MGKGPREGIGPHSPNPSTNSVSRTTVLCRFCTRNHCHCELINTVAMPCPRHVFFCGMPLPFLHLIHSSVLSSQCFLSLGGSDTDFPFRFECSTGRLWFKICIANLTHRISSLLRKEHTFTCSYMYTCICMYENINKHVFAHVHIYIKLYAHIHKDLNLSKYADI